MAVKVFDYIIGYENKPREIESACLIKYELERRGYSVKIFQEFDQRFDDVNEVLFHAKVLILSCGYGDKYVKAFCRRFLTFDKLVNWQWEQILEKDEEDTADNYVGVNGPMSRSACQLCWGERMKHRETDIIGIAPEQVFVTGNVSMDFAKERFDRFYESKETIIKRYKLPADKKMMLFIGSFPLAFMPEEGIIDREQASGKPYHDIAKNNYNRFLTEMGWVKEVLSESDEFYCVYRPHPGEEYDRCPKEIQEFLDELVSSGKFFIIQDLSIKQWIKIADRIYCGYSTSTAEAYYAGKSCYMLSPRDIPEDQEIYYFDNANTIGTREEFLKTFENDSFFCSIDQKMLDDYFTASKDYCYEKMADVLETIIKQDRYNVDISPLLENAEKIRKEQFAGKSFLKKAKLNLWKYDWFYKLFWTITELPVKSSYFDKQKEYHKEIITYRNSYIATQAEIDEINARLKRCFE